MQTQLRKLLVAAVHDEKLVLQSLKSKGAERAGDIAIQAAIRTVTRQDASIENVVARLGAEDSVDGVSWQALDKVMEME
jgi:uncharacterized membrane protein YhiD involved in acid resistance